MLTPIRHQRHHDPRPTWLRSLAMCVVIPSIWAACARAAESFDVELKSGRHFVADVDPRTDRDTLWLNFGGPAATVSRPIEWERVVRVTDGTRTYTGAEFVPLALARAAEVAAAADSEHPTTDTSTVTLAARYVGPNASPAATSPRVAYIDVDAFVANWDGDVEADGVVAYVMPVDRDGNYVAVSGNLVVELFGERPKTPPAGEKFPRLGRWSRNVTPADFGPRGAVFHLKFQAVHPDFDRRVTAYGLLHARLNVPGSGTFENSVATLRIKPYSAYRDALQMHRGSRFLHVERLGRTH
jgi:hypothetical protein